MYKISNNVVKAKRCFKAEFVIVSEKNSFKDTELSKFVKKVASISLSMKKK
jgi:hypothetical protein